MTEAIVVADPTPASGTDPASVTPNVDRLGGADKTFSQAELDAILKDRLTRQQRKLDADKATAEEAAKQAALTEQGEFKKLAEAHATKIAALEPVAAKAERYEAALKAHLDGQRKDLPAYIASLLDKISDPVEQLEWIAANREALVPKGANGHIPTTPKPDDGKALSESEKARAMQVAGAQMGKFF